MVVELGGGAHIFSFDLSTTTFPICQTPKTRVNSQFQIPGVVGSKVGMGGVQHVPEETGCGIVAEIDV